MIPALFDEIDEEFGPKITRRPDPCIPAERKPSLKVVTCMWGSAWGRYGEIFDRSWSRYWSEEAELVVVADRELPLTRGRQIMMHRLPSYNSFMDAWRHVPAANGKDNPPGRKVDENGYSWRHDAVKWMPQGISPALALEGMEDGDVLVWMDADVETVAPVDEAWVDGLLAGADVCCLQRGKTHTEIGFYACRINDRTRKFIRKFSDFYLSGDVFSLKETHSAYVFDRSLEAVSGINVRNLSPGGKGHVFAKSELKRHLVHFKGKRKDRR